MGRTAWGKQKFDASFKLNGRSYTDKLTITGVIKDNFEKLTKAEIERAGIPVIDRSYFEFGEIKKGATVTATYSIRNKGKSPLVIHHAEGQGRWSAGSSDHTWRRPTSAGRCCAG